MRDWLFCILEVLVYTCGVMSVCAYGIELCHRATYALLGRRVSRFFWYATALPGAPVHELGHALFCPIFAHRIERFRPLPMGQNAACVEHSYNRRNPWAALGNIVIGIGPILSGFAVMIAVLYGIFPAAMHTCADAVSEICRSGSVGGQQLVHFPLAFLGAMIVETSTPRWLQPIGWYLLLSMSLHVRLSAADLRSMAPGIPWAVLAAVLIATVIVLLGADATTAATTALQSFALLQCALFTLIFLFSFLCLAFSAVYRMLSGIFRA